MHPQIKRFGPPVIILLVVVGVTFFAVRTGKESPPKFTNTKEVVIPTVTLKDSYKKGTHTYAGSLSVPTPCHTVSATIAVTPGTPDAVRIDVTAPPDEGMCVQLVTTKTFSLTAKAGSDATVGVYVNGTLAPLQN